MEFGRCSVYSNYGKGFVITVVYCTNRKVNHLEWFLDSLDRQIREANEDMRTLQAKLVIVTGYAPGEDTWSRSLENIFVAPKPNVWSGKHRLTTQNYFSASSARNTGLCYAPDGYIVYVDDLSVLIPGWWVQVKLAAVGGYIALGTYRKVNKLVVKGGLVESFEDHPSGHDSRIPSFTSQDPFVVTGSWMYGCSMAIPVEALLQVNGFDENCDAMGGEDTGTGIMLGRNGFEFRMCPKMVTWESEEDHHVETPAKRIIKPYPGYIDSSHAIRDWTMNGDRLHFQNSQNMRETRAKVLALQAVDMHKGAEAFPIPTEPSIHWPDQQPLSTM